MAGEDYSPPGATSGGRATLGGATTSKVDYSKPVAKKTKSITYSAGDNALLLDVSDTASESADKSAQIQAVKVKNEGYVPANAIFAYTKYTAEDDASEAVEYVQYLLNPEEEIILPATRAIIATTNEQYDGTAVTATAPNSNEYIDSTANADSATSAGIIGSASTTRLYLEPYTSAANCSANLFRVGDLIRSTNEIMEVTEIGSKADLANNYLTVRRGVHGSDAASDHSDGDAILLPFFNAYHDFDRYSVAQTDSNGRWKSLNFFGYGRTATGKSGITPGSVAIQFYESGYQGFGMSGINSNSESGLAASTEYGFDITVDGSGNLTSDFMKFTTSTNTKFGGSDGIIAKMQEALDTYYYTTGSNILNEKVTVGLEGGDVVFRSGSYLSTSAILLAAPSAGETTPFGVGRIPAIGSINAAVAARLQTETTTDPVTNASTYKNIFIRDDGRGNLIWKNERTIGSINYETGALDWSLPERPNAEFVVSVLHTSPFSGKLNAADADAANSLVQVLGNTPQQKCEAILTVETF